MPIALAVSQGIAPDVSGAGDGDVKLGKGMKREGRVYVAISSSTKGAYTCRLKAFEKAQLRP